MNIEHFVVPENKKVIISQDSMSKETEGHTANLSKLQEQDFSCSLVTTEPNWA
jgi:hypothetical protein